MADDGRHDSFGASYFVVLSSDCYFGDFDLFGISSVLPVLMVLFSQSLLDQFLDLHERSFV